MMPKEYWDENRNYRFDFSEADRVFEVHEMARKASLNDVLLLIHRHLEIRFYKWIVDKSFVKI